MSKLRLLQGQEPPAPTAEQRITELNEAWQQGDICAILAAYHPDAVLFPPGDAAPIQGDGELAETYTCFLTEAILHRFKTLELTSFPFQQVTLVQLKFEVEYELEEQRFLERGTENYAVDARGQILWRQQLVSSTDEID